VAPGEQKSVQVISNGICTVSDAVSHDEDEHMTSEDRALAFAERMLVIWQQLVIKARSEVKKAQPTATPV
jgi:purine-nucleoside phosphorylase